MKITVGTNTIKKMIEEDGYCIYKLIRYLTNL